MLTELITFYFLCGQNEQALLMPHIRTLGWPVILLGMNVTF
jgi:hypothetical protein